MPAVTLIVANTAPEGTGAPATDTAMIDPMAATPALAADGRTPVRSPATRLRVNASAVSRRRKALVDSGVLYFETDIHPAALGGTGDAMVWMDLPPGRIRSAGRRLRTDPRVRFAAATSDLVAHVPVIDHQTLLEFVDETLAELDVTSTNVTCAQAQCRVSRAQASCTDSHERVSSRSAARASADVASICVRSRSDCVWRSTSAASCLRGVRFSASACRLGWSLSSRLTLIVVAVTGLGGRGRRLSFS